MPPKHLFLDAPILLDTDSPTEGAVSGAIPLDKRDAHHLLRVLRLKDGAPLTATDGSGWLYEGTLSCNPTPHLHVTNRRKLPHQHSGPSLTLLYGLAKGQKPTFVIQKATELGIERILPVVCQRSVAQPKLADRKMHRWLEISRQAARQAHRTSLPVIEEPASLQQQLSHLGNADQPRFVASIGGEALDLLLPRATEAESIVFAVGPEGGFSEAETSTLAGASFKAIQLGPTILRSETAAVALSAVLAFATGRWSCTP